MTTLQSEVTPLAHRSRISAAAGAGIWFIFAVTNGRVAFLSGIDLLLLLAVLAIVPLGMSLVPRKGMPTPAAQLFALSTWLQPVGAVLVGLSLMRPKGAPAALAAVWLAYTALVALVALMRLAATRQWTTGTMATTVGLLYLPAGATWLLFHRLGVQPLDLLTVMVLLTVVHFHYGGFALPIMAGSLEDFIPVSGPVRRLYRLATGGVTVGPALVTAGIILAQQGNHVLQLVAVVLEAAAAVLLALVALAMVGRATSDRLAQLLLAIAAISAIFAMLLATAYALGTYTGRPIFEDELGITKMVIWHGLTSAFGFALCGLLGLAMARPDEDST